MKLNRSQRVHDSIQKKLMREQIEEMKNPNNQYLFVIRADLFTRSRYFPSIRIGRKYVKSNYNSKKVYVEIWNLIKLNGSYKKSFATKKYSDCKKYEIDIIQRN